MRGGKLFVFCLAGFLGLLLSSQPAQAQGSCWGYLQIGPFQCQSLDGQCSSEYYTTRCNLGCLSGECYNQGGSGECCGQLYYSAIIYPDGDPHGCDNDCEVIIGLRPNGSSASKYVVASNPSKLSERTLESGYPTIRLTYVPDTCRGTYAVIWDARSLLLRRL
jgi:hypothetical protein